MSKNVVEKFQYLNEYAKFRYENELRREDSIIRQASQMQTAFSFVTAAMFMVAPIVIEYSRKLSLTFFLIVFSSITIALLFSLLFATLAQNREISKNFEDVSNFIKYVEDNENYFGTEKHRLKHIIDTYGDVQKDKAIINDKRVKLIRISMWMFYVALGLCAFWFIIAICKTVQEVNSLFERESTDKDSKIIQKPSESENSIKEVKTAPVLTKIERYSKHSNSSNDEK